MACKLAATPIQGKKITGFEGEYGLNFAPDTWTAAVVATEGTYLLPDGKVNWDSKAGRERMAWQKEAVDKKGGGPPPFTDNNGPRHRPQAAPAPGTNPPHPRPPPHSHPPNNTKRGPPLRSPAPAP